LTLKLYKKAITIYEKALLAEPLSINLHIGKGEALLGLRRSNEALAAYEQAIHLAPNSSVAHKGQGKAFEQLAQQAFDEASKQAQECYERAKQLGVE
jgi:tetratricopeptide (TPR) repeat protein